MTKNAEKQVLFKRIQESRNTTFAQTQIFNWPDITVEFYNGWTEQKSDLMKKWAIVHELAHVMDKENDDKNHINYATVSDGYNYFDTADNKLKYGIRSGIMATIYGTTGDQEDWAESVTAYIYRNEGLIINDAVAWPVVMR